MAVAFFETQQDTLATAAWQHMPCNCYVSFDFYYNYFRIDIIAFVMLLCFFR